jgi:peroxiredoxin Q/BCP
MAEKAPVVGDFAPDVELTLHTGDRVHLQELQGHKVLLWFYPKDDTPG